MNKSGIDEVSDTTGERLSRRDLFLLPAISLMAICFISASVELTARRMFPSTTTYVAQDCMILNDSSTGVRGVPNSVCWDQHTDTKLAEYRFNSCGYRAGMVCGPKPEGTYRIALEGTSFAEGLGMPREETFAALLPIELSRTLKRRVELYNNAMEWRSPRVIALRFNEVLAEKPDMILWALSPWEIGNASFLLPDSATSKEIEKHVRTSAKPSGTLERAWLQMKTAFATKSFSNAVLNIWDKTRTAVLLKHFLYESPSQYMRFYLMTGETDSAGAEPTAEWQSLRAEPSARWKEHLQEFSQYAKEIESKANAAGIPLVIVLLPIHPQAAMISVGEWPAGFDPYRLDKELRPIVENLGAIYIDILQDVGQAPKLDESYFPVDGHLNTEGNLLISRLLAKELTNGAVSGIRLKSWPITGSEAGK